MKDFQDRYSSMFRAALRGREQCPASESFADLAAGRAWPWKRRRLVQHLSHCSDCADDYRVLTAARGGLSGVLDAHGRADERAAAGWLRPGLVAATAVVMVALSVSLLVRTDAPSPGADHGVLFASQFEPGPSAGQREVQSERLFTSDFGEAEGEGAQLFRDDFGG